MFLTSNQLKYKSSIHNIVICCEKAILSETGETCAYNKWRQSKRFWTNMLVDFDLRGQWRMDFFTEGSIIIMDLYCGQ